MLTFKKGEDTKLIDPESKLIPRLLEDGWKEESKKESKKPKKEDKE